MARDLEAQGFTAEEIAHCRAAMAKPAPMAALRLIASGRAIIEVTRNGREVLLDSIDGRAVRDDAHPDRKMRIAGAWPLYIAGMIDRFGVVTPAGRAALASHERRGDAP